MDLNNIRTSIRKNFPETNSSSSHSVSISLSGKYYKPEEWNIEIQDDGTIFIPNSIDDFGWEFRKYNDVLTKIQYVSSIFYVKENPKKLKILKDVIKSFTGAKRVIFEFEKDFEEECRDYLKKNEKLNLKDIINFGSEIDHGSNSIFPQILESKNTIKDFIFNPSSWLFLGNDNSNTPDKFFLTPESHEKESDAIVSINFGGIIGRVDFELNQFPPKKNLIKTLYEIDQFGILDSIFIDRNTGEIIDIRKITNPRQFMTLDCLRLFKFSKVYNNIGKIKESIYVAYTSKEFDELFFSKERKKDDKENDYEKTFIELINTLESPKYYKLFPVKLITKEFGELL